MKGRHLFLHAAALTIASPALAQPVDLPIAPATTDQYPAGVKVIKAASGPIYANDKGVTLYGMDMRTLTRWGADPSQYCKDECAERWEPMLAPPGTKPNLVLPRGFGAPPPAAGQAPRPSQDAAPAGMFNALRAPDWTVIGSAAGAQWVYKGWHLVFIRKGDKPGSTAFEGAEALTWNTLKFVPQVPKVVAPLTVAPVFRQGEYVLGDKNGRVLFTGSCGKACADWRPLAAPAAGRGIGEWSIARNGDTPQWTYRGKPVFYSLADDPTVLPASAKALKP